MAEPFVFDPRSEQCKRPYGAVPCGSAVSFFVRPLASEGFSRCTLRARGEFSGARYDLPLTAAGSAGERTLFTGVFNVPEEPELLWYHFSLAREDGSECALDPSGYRGEGEPLDWQITVYRENHTPAWFGEGVTYQIFPDRFCRLGVPDGAGMIGDRTVHENWEDAPVWQPDEDGEIRNRDFFGGSLAGIAAHLDDLAAMGVSNLYLNPIFESASNHRYNTADYLRVDPMLGTEEDFRALCGAARERGIRVILDGVFNHTGSQSRYFNADGYYPEPGAAQSRQSPYYDWFSFHPWPTDYDAWWGIRTLPAVREDSPSYTAFIAGDGDSVIRRWLRAGASGWRLDVADELPDEFIETLRAAVEETDPDAILIGEVWEDASTKIAYDRRRRYFLGSELHGVMNYPFRTALLAYLAGGDADDFRESMESLREHYPRDAFYSAMNFLGTHDTPRILTVLGAAETPEDKGARAAYRLSDAERALGLARLRLAALILFTFPGSPTVYYGDEAGMEGFEDPLNRGTYPWGREDAALWEHFARLGNLRRDFPALRRGAIHWLYTAGSLLLFAREAEGRTLVTAVNAGGETQSVPIPWAGETARDLLSGAVIPAENGGLTLTLPPRSGMLLL